LDDVDVSVTPVPEQSTLTLLGIGLVGLLIARKRIAVSRTTSIARNDA
jgi:hypothetical protein